MKGFVNLQLIDANTGIIKQELLKEENEITTALQDIIKTSGQLAFLTVNFYTNGYYRNYIRELFSGIYLLGSTQAVGSIIPKGEIIGLGGQSTTANIKVSPKGGSKVNAESEIFSNNTGFKLTWQWNTTEGNGTINAVALTGPYLHDKGGLWANTVNNHLGALQANLGVGKSVTGPVFLTPRNVGQTIQKRDILPNPFSSNPIQNLYSSHAESADKVYQPIKVTSLYTFANNEYIYGLTNYGDYLYVLFKDTNDSKWYIRKISQAGSVIETIELIDFNPSATYAYGIAVNDNYIAIGINHNPGTVIIYNRSGIAQRTVTLTEIFASIYDDSQPMGVTFLLDTDIIAFTDAYRSSSAVSPKSSLIDCSDGTIIFESQQPSSTTEEFVFKNGYGHLDNLLKPIGTGYTTNAYLGYITFGMSTLKNLTTPIVKTNSDILKVTYTILYA